MLPETSITALVVALSVFLVFVWQKQRTRRVTALLPPSPPDEWLIGHLRTLPPDSDHTYFAKLSQELNSDILSFTVLGKTTVVLNSTTATNDLLEKRSAIYSSRPEMTVITDERLFDWRNHAAICPSGHRHRVYRKMMHKFLSRNACKVYHAYQEAEIRAFIKRLLISSDQVEDNLQQAAAGIIMQITYGYPVGTADDRLVHLATVTNHNFMRAALPSNHLVNVIPALKYVPPWLPGARWKRSVLEWRGQKETVIEETFEWTKRRIQHGVAEPSIVQTLLTDISEYGMDVEEVEGHIKELAGTLFTAGVDTTVSTFMSFILAIILFPDVQDKARAEVDRVIGPDRLPTMQDMDSLPYISAVIQEVIRWRPLAPLSLPYSVTQDDMYRGYFIPKGTTILGNIWAITRDSDVYPDPETFNPDRFYNQPTPPAPGFGWGRRICPGQYIAEGTLFVAITSVLAAFTISKAEDERGNEITPTTEAREKPSLLYLHRSDVGLKFVLTTTVP